MFLHKKDQDLGLTLSLGCGGAGGGPSSSKPNTTTTATMASTPFKLNPMMIPSPYSPSPASPSPSPSSGFLQKLPWNTSIGSDGAFLRGIDVNRAEEEEEETEGVSSPKSTVSTISGGKRNCDDLHVERTSSRGMSDEDDGTDNLRKKLRLTKDQSAILEDSFKEHSTLNPKQKLALARRLGLRPRQVEVWFQNRRARTKLKQTEVDCEFLKRCCEQLTEENRRLHKEVAELRALKLSPHFYMHMTPPTTLTVCPSCDRAAVPPPPSVQAAHRPVAIRPLEALLPRS